MPDDDKTVVKDDKTPREVKDDKTPAAGSGKELRVGRIAALVQQEMRTFNERLTKLESTKPAGDLEEEVSREELREEFENCFDELGREIANFFGVGGEAKTEDKTDGK